MITEELMEKVRQLEIITSRSVNEVFAGEYSSAFRGRGMEFDEVREYAPGDEIRTIDWNVTARTGIPHIKRYVEERELTIMLLVDVSASSVFGSAHRLKCETAAEVCGVLAFAATRNNDRVGMLTFVDDVRTVIPAKKGTNHVLRIMRELIEEGTGASPPAGGAPSGEGPVGQASRLSTTSPGTTAALEHLARVQRRRAVLFVLSDFLHPMGAFAPGSPLEISLRLASRRHDTVAVRIGDPRERGLPRVGLIGLRDAETGAVRTVDTSSKRVRERYAKNAEMRTRALRAMCRRTKVDFADITTGEPYIRTLVELFKRREGRR